MLSICEGLLKQPSIFAFGLCTTWCSHNEEYVQNFECTQIMMISTVPRLGISDLRLLIRLRGKNIGTVLGCYRGKAADAALASTKGCIGVSSQQQLEDGHSCDKRNSAEMEFKMAQSFDKIPGPKGLPHFGTLFEYKFGKIDVCTS